MSASGPGKAIKKASTVTGNLPGCWITIQEVGKHSSFRMESQKRVRGFVIQASKFLQEERFSSQAVATAAVFLLATSLPLLCRAWQGVRIQNHLGSSCEGWYSCSHICARSASLASHKVAMTMGGSGGESCCWIFPQLSSDTLNLDYVHTF